MVTVKIYTCNQDAYLMSFMYEIRVTFYSFLRYSYDIYRLCYHAACLKSFDLISSIKNHHGGTLVKCFGDIYMTENRILQQFS